MEGAANSMTSIFTMLGQYVTAVAGTLDTWMDAILASDVLTFLIIVAPLVGVGIGIIRRLIGLR